MDESGSGGHYKRNSHPTASRACHLGKKWRGNDGLIADRTTCPEEEEEDDSGSGGLYKRNSHPTTPRACRLGKKSIRGNVDKEEDHDYEEDDYYSDDVDDKITDGRMPTEACHKNMSEAERVQTQRHHAHFMERAFPLNKPLPEGVPHQTVAATIKMCPDKKDIYKIIYIVDNWQPGL